MYRVTMIFLLGLLPLGVCAQKRQKKNNSYRAADSIALIREFMTVCNYYKTLPLQLDLRFETTSNIIAGPEDSIKIDASFHMDHTGSYIRFGELEQVVDDTLMVLVSHDLKRMLVYPNHISVSNQLQHYLGVQIRDSTFEAIASRFICAKGTPDNDTVEARLVSRQQVVKLGLPKESVTIRYHPHLKSLYEVVQVNRNLIKISKDQYEAAQGVPQYEGKLLEAEGEYYVLKENTAVYSYRQVGHARDLKVPVAVKDRVMRDANGALIPAIGYENFEVTTNF